MAKVEDKGITLVAKLERERKQEAEKETAEFSFFFYFSTCPSLSTSEVLAEVLPTQPHIGAMR